MWFGLLGSFCLWHKGAEVPVPAARQRILLAALLVRAGHVVSADELCEAVWDGMPPAGAAVTLRSYVARLRRALGPVPGSRIVTRCPGYAIEAGADELDLLCFAALCRDGGAAALSGAWQQASGVLTLALGLWRGAPLADIPSRVLRDGEVPYLEQLRLQAAEDRIEADLHLGRPGGLVPELRALVAENPLRERFRAQLMLALYRCGRQGEALAVYRQARRYLIDELGVEPGAGLRGLHQQILDGDPALDVERRAGLR